MMVTISSQPVTARTSLILAGSGTESAPGKPHTSTRAPSDGSNEPPVAATMVLLNLASLPSSLSEDMLPAVLRWRS